MSDKTLGAYQRHETPDCTAEQGDYVCTRETGHPGPHIAATRVLNHAVSAVWDERPRDDALALLAEAQEEATRQATRADQAELDRDNARRWLRETEALLDQAGHERDEARVHLEAQEPSDAEVRAAAFAVMSLDADRGLDGFAYSAIALAALSAARAARRDEEKRDG